MIRFLRRFVPVLREIDRLREENARLVESIAQIQVDFDESQFEILAANIRGLGYSAKCEIEPLFAKLDSVSNEVLHEGYVHRGHMPMIGADNLRAVLCEVRVATIRWLNLVLDSTEPGSVAATEVFGGFTEGEKSVG